MERLTIPVYRRLAFLRRNPALSRQEFSSHYERHHGPLAASLVGFRKFVRRYVQNHVEDLPGGKEPPFDGVTMTTQVPREDYSRGFSSEPDYLAILRPDENYLFDLAKTVAVLGREEITREGSQSAHKALLLGDPAILESMQPKLLPKRVLNHLDPSTANRLGRGSGEFQFDLLSEVWFETKESRDEALDASVVTRVNSMLLPVRELVIFGPEKPWVGDA